MIYSRHKKEELYIKRHCRYVFFDFFNRNSMKKLISHSLKVWMVSALFLCSVAGTLVAAPQAVALPLAPRFSAVSLDGKSIASSQFAGKAYIVNFFASWCPPCRSEIPDMVTLQSKYGRQGFTFIGVAVNETEPTIRAFMAKNGINYPVAMADEQLTNVFSRYVAGGIRAIPTSFVINSSGQITQVITGARSKEVFEKIIIDALRKPATQK
jgi:thiol-disulfide isomerase/thioredoxin